MAREVTQKQGNAKDDNGETEACHWDALLAYDNDSKPKEGSGSLNIWLWNTSMCSFVVQVATAPCHGGLAVVSNNATKQKTGAIVSV